MKLKMFFVFILTFIFIPNICLADEYIFNLNDNSELLYKLCTTENGGCTYYWNDGYKTAGAYKGDPSNPTWRGPEDSGLKIEKFSFAQYKTISQLKTFFGNNNCGDKKCYVYVKETYCNNWNSNESVCKKLGELDGSSNNILTDDDGNITRQTCTVPVPIKTDNLETTDVKFIYTPNNGELLIDNASISMVNKLDSNGYFTMRKDKYFLHEYNDNSGYAQFKKDYIKKLNESGTCPNITFCLKDLDKIDGYYEWYANLTGECDKNVYSGLNFSTDDNGFGDYEVSDDVDFNLIGDEIDPPKTCADLLSGDGGEELIKLLRTVITIIKILVPILLLGLGIMDFGKAVFSGEDQMKKAQAKFIKRVIIAVFIFLVPTILHLLLTVASWVWPNISADMCGILK